MSEPTTDMAMIGLTEVVKRYPGQSRAAVDGVSLEVGTGEWLALVGGSGSGKTTTLKLINRLIEPSSGRITVAGDDVSQWDVTTLRRRIGYVFQGVGLFPHWNVGRNVAITLSLAGWSRSAIEARVDEMLEWVGLPPAQYRERSVGQLSGGQRQRVGVARALAARPEVLLMDEPFGALDPITRGELQQEFKRLQQELAVTVVMVTHDMAEALLLGDRVAVMKSGRLLQLGSPAQLLNSPADPYVAELTAAPKRQAHALAQLLQQSNATLPASSPTHLLNRESH